MKKKPKRIISSNNRLIIYSVHKSVSLFIYFGVTVEASEESAAQFHPTFSAFFFFFFLNIVCPLPPCSVTIPPACVVIRADEQT